MDLQTPLDIICRIIIRSREVEAQVPGIDPENDDPVNDSEDERDVLEDELDETAVDELRGVIEDLADDQQIELLALALVGQGTYDASEWEDALEEAGDGGAEPAIDLLLDMPTLSENLEAGLAAFDLSCDGVGQID